MTQQHTPEPWAFGEDNDGWYVEKDRDQFVYGLTEANARRIVACVNACAGISTESMEVGGVGSILSLGLEEQRRGDVAEQQRDALLAALEDIAQWTERYTQPGHPISTVARRAIASVKAKP